MTRDHATYLTIPRPYPSLCVSDPRPAGTSSDGARRQGEGEDIGQGGEPLQPHGLRAGREDMRGRVLADDQALQGWMALVSN